MFGAPQQFAQPVPTGIADPDYSYWRAVELTLAVQWYVVGIGDRVDDGWVMRDLLVSWSRDLLNVLRPTEQTMAMSVQLMKPMRGTMNAPWQLVELKRIWTAVVSATEETKCVVFEGVDGVRFADPMERISLADLSGFQLVWAAPSPDFFSSTKA